MTDLATDPITLGHVAITLIAIASGFLLLFAMLGGKGPKTLTQIFLLFTFLTSATGYLLRPAVPPPSPAQVVGGVALVVLAVAVYALYGRRLAGAWRPVYVVTAVLSLYLNVFVLVIQSFLKVLAPAVPPAGPVFGAVQGVVLIFFVVTGWLAVRRFHPHLA